MIPRTSSNTAAAKIVTPSGESIFFLSDKILAVIPTDVAVDMTPRKRQTGSAKFPISPVKAFKMNMAETSPKTKEKTTPPIPIIPPETEYFMKSPKSVSSPDAKRSIMEAI